MHFTTVVSIISYFKNIFNTQVAAMMKMMSKGEEPLSYITVDSKTFCLTDILSPTKIYHCKVQLNGIFVTTR